MNSAVFLAIKSQVLEAIVHIITKRMRLVKVQDNSKSKYHQHFLVMSAF